MRTGSDRAGVASFLVARWGEWDKAAFSRFEKAMRWACEHFQDEDRLDRWMAEGFHYASWFVRDWTSHPHFPRPEPEQYYNDCIQRIGDLSDWFFRGWHAYTEPHHWPDLLASQQRDSGAFLTADRPAPIRCVPALPAATQTTSSRSLEYTGTLSPPLTLNSRG